MHKRPDNRILRKARDEMIECLARNGFTYESIGDAFGVTRQRIEQIINGGRK